MTGFKGALETLGRPCIPRGRLPWALVREKELVVDGRYLLARSLVVPLSRRGKVGGAGEVQGSSP